ncbi:ribonuclease D [Fodinicurvata sediminis]|uniref:ribonuclease D n=1 Tax=Fodinicurvata sediminis TaxID=1121832 RepID=UPI0003B444CA|nr:ribonuclease D [Fodinicurvata sediminis]
MRIITDTSSLEAFCNTQESSDYITIDTEFMRDTSYWPKLCLIQVGGADEAVIIDPLSEGLDLEPLYALLRNPNVTKVFHAARQDLEIFYQRMGSVPAPVFDTQVAAMVCGFGDQVSYEKLVAALTSESIDKGARFTDWSRRPLGQKQLSYALADVTHLRDVYQKLRRRLEKNGRESWLGDEMAVLADPETYQNDPDKAWQRLKSRSRDRRYLAVMRALATWREKEAQSRDVPRSRILKDEQIYDLASNRPTAIDGLARARGISADMAKGRIGREILKIIEETTSLPKNQLPTAADQDDSNRDEASPALIELMKVLLKAKCEEHEIAQKLLANVSDLEQIALDDNADVPALKGWRREIFGHYALELKQGRIALTADDRSVKVLSLD